MNLNITDQNFHDIARKLILDQRKASKGTNLQNIPSKGYGDDIRRCFLPPEGYVLVGADLSQIEPRIQAHIMYDRYGDNSFRQIFIDGVDLYSTMAAKTFNLSMEYCLDKAYDPTETFQPRKLMKMGVLAVAYRQSVEAFSKNMKVDMETAERFFQGFNEQFPSFETMVVDIIEGMKQTGYVETLFGRKRRWPDYKKMKALADKKQQELFRLYRERKKMSDMDKNRTRLKQIQKKIDELSEPRRLVSAWERQSFNAVIQGTGADILKKIGIEYGRVCREKGWLMMASIHDEIITALPKTDVTPDNIALINRIMTETATLSMPLKTDIVIMDRWMEERTPEEYFARV